MERSFVMIKPDGVQRQLVGELLAKFEKKGFRLAGAKFMKVSEDLAKKHYGEHEGKPFFGELVGFITSGPVFAMAIEGPNCISMIRKMVGATKPEDAEPGSIRGDYVSYMGKNIIHASDSPESAKRELALWFTADELIDYTRSADAWIYA
ncbi:MAG TPA: nucleoside-diphosphate kinase [Spirochaetota bacterium]|nr:nucleoside-diphosphate kinase [Spirochaetota bacterium]